ncbi:MAG TPA: transcriptional repressor [Hymenobacter sp.]|uniref:Fur family transcriptional regulator n=1 Tax=Hymenobacter sp. TaxID=1898978 RepID=UPI002D8075E2|nr:transcriptional repressor [Hymenobacter sp.]HET9503448.1 transcriptional repressor [Hymenobacter sp.]
MPTPLAPATTAPDRLAQTLLRHGLRQTPVRRAVLAALTGKGYALTGAEIEQEIGSEVDRITLYRTLKSFEQQGLIHRVIDDTDVLRYAACSIECSAGSHFDNHVHFKCTTCQHTYCLSQVAIPIVQLPGGFQAERRDFLLSGVCQLCQPL